MELTVTVRGLTGGVDLNICIVTKSCEGSAEVEEPAWFSCNEVGDWAAGEGYSRRTATAVFNSLYAAAYEEKIDARHTCTRPKCTGRYCEGVHRISGADTLRLPAEALAVKGIGRGGSRFGLLEDFLNHTRRAQAA